MATNDVNLQVINSMTQEQMQSLKDSDGKIPSLANQLIMTDEEIDIFSYTSGLELIYTNNNVSAGFASQTLSLDLSTYSDVVIYCVATNAVATPNLCIVSPIGNTNALHMRIAYFDTGTAKMRQTARQVTSISNSGITFGDGFFDGSTSASLNACIPKYIFARKSEVKVSAENGVISSKGLEYVGYYSADGNVSVDIDLDKYDYFAFVRINTNSSSSVNLGIFPNTSFSVYTNDQSASSTFSYCYLFYAKSFSTSLYITYNQNNDGYVRVYPSDRGVTFASSTSKPTKLTTYSSGTVTIANIILYRRKK